MNKDFKDPALSAVLQALDDTPPGKERSILLKEKTYLEQHPIKFIQSRRKLKEIEKLETSLSAWEKRLKTVIRPDREKRCKDQITTLKQEIKKLKQQFYYLYDKESESNLNYKTEIAIATQEQERRLKIGQLKSRITNLERSAKRWDLRGRMEIASNKKDEYFAKRDNALAELSRLSSELVPPEEHVLVPPEEHVLVPAQEQRAQP